MANKIKRGLVKLKGITGRRRALLLVIVLVAVGLLAAAVWRKDEPAQTTSQEAVVTNSTSDPDESLANAKNYNWQGAPDEPKKLFIDKIGLESFIQKMGVDQNKQVAVPTNVHLAGWFANSVKPGQKGLAIIDGHVHGKKDVGVFLKIGELKKGDHFVIERGDGSKLEYEVIDNVSVAEAKSAGVVFSADPRVVTGQVNLVTCGGQYDRAKGEYPNRVIVSGKLITS